MHKRITIALAAPTFAAGCTQDPTAASSNELVLAQSSQAIADNVAATPSGGTNCVGWFRRLLDTLRTTDDPEARAFLVAARANRDSAWAAVHAGGTAAARPYR